jgi:hypothetical protein
MLPSDYLREKDGLAFSKTNDGRDDGRKRRTAEDFGSN